jgi:hypothetical protein
MIGVFHVTIWFMYSVLLISVYIALAQFLES